MGYKAKIIVSALAITFISLFLFAYGAFAEGKQGENKLVAEEMITSGAKLENWEWFTSSGKVVINLIEVDLYNPYVKLDTIIGKDGMTGNKQQIGKMATEANAVAAINGDFFTLTAEGAPFGTHIQSGELISSPAYIYSKNAFMLNMDNVPFINQMDFSGTVKAKDGASFRLFGINKTQYQAGYRYSGNSHQNRLHMYTDLWNMGNWVGKSLDNYVVVLVENGKATRKMLNQTVGNIPKDAYLLLGHGDAAKFLQEHISIGETVDLDITILPNGEWSLVLEGSTLLIDEGKRASILTEVVGNHARTAIGYSKNKRYVYLVTAEKSNNSVGMTLAELTDFLLYRGIYKGVNMDGGGSTTMVARPLGMSGLTDVTIPTYGSEREVPNGLAIFSTAPKGELSGFNITIPNRVFLGERIPTAVQSAYDQYFNPVVVNSVLVNWTIPSEGVELDDTGNLIFKKTGTFELKAKSGKVEESYKVTVYDKQDIKEIKFDQESLRLHVSESLRPTVTITLKNGTKQTINNSLLDWRLNGAKGTVDNDGFVLALEQSEGLLIASYQGFSTSIPISIGGSGNIRLIDSFSNRGHYLLSHYAGSESSSFDVADGMLKYDFGNSDNLRIVYLNYGTLGKQVIGEPATLRLQVNGDDSGHWLRTEVRDAKGKIYYLDLAKQVDWTGWKQLTVPLPANISYPITIKSIYVVHLENTKDTTRTNGQLGFSQFEVKDWFKPSEIVRNYLRFTLNEKEVAVGTTKVVLDQGPVVLTGRTYLPIRHIAELLGGTVTWIGQEQKVEIIKDGKIYNFWLNEAFISNNGLMQEIDSMPFIKDGRTLLPLRVISESFGLYINYDSKTKSIVIH